MIFICIPVFNRYSYTKKCLESIQQQIYKEFVVIVCDDGSTDFTSNMLSIDFPEVIILKGDGNLWWAGATNLCIDYALKNAHSNDFIFTLNNDTILEPNTLSTLITFSESKPQSLIACGNYFENDREKLEMTAFVKKSKGFFPLLHKPLFPWGQNITGLKDSIYEISSVAGKGVLIPIMVFYKIGLYRSKELPQYHSDTEFSRRAFEAGFKIYINLNAKIYTDQNASGIGQINSKVSLREFILSLFSLRSGNHLKTQYNRSKLIYKKNWQVYLVSNIFVITLDFFKRYSFYHLQRTFKWFNK